jgi:hypothetical protein
MPRLTFRLKKNADAKAQLILVREDGTHTAGTIGPTDGYGPVHDLTHFAIESTLGVDDGFLGLCASGWEISDFEVRGTPARLPAGAIFAEVAAGELSRQLLTRQVTSLEDFLWAIDLTFKQHPGGVDRPQITEEQFNTIHALIAEQWKRWRELEANGVLELTFNSRRRSDCAAPTPAERRAGRVAGS